MNADTPAWVVLLITVLSAVIVFLQSLHVKSAKKQVLMLTSTLHKIDDGHNELLRQLTRADRERVAKDSVATVAEIRQMNDKEPEDLKTASKPEDLEIRMKIIDRRLNDVEHGHYALYKLVMADIAYKEAQKAEESTDE